MINIYDTIMEQSNQIRSLVTTKSQFYHSAIVHSVMFFTPQNTGLSPLHIVSKMLKSKRRTPSLNPCFYRDNRYKTTRLCSTTTCSFFNHLKFELCFSQLFLGLIPPLCRPTRLQPVFTLSLRTTKPSRRISGLRVFWSL